MTNAKFPLVALGCWLVTACLGQPPAATTATETRPSGPRGRDNAAVMSLTETGDRVESDRAIVWFEAGGMSADEETAFSKRVNQGIANLEKLLGLRFDPSRFAMKKVPYYVTDSVGISHTSMSGGPHIFLQMRRAKTDSTPYLHETAHLLLRTNQPGRDGEDELWMSEGFASYLEDYIVESVGGQPSRLFTKNGNRGVDKESLAWIQTEDGRNVLPYIGLHGSPEGMRSDREHVAQPFYVLSQSFCKYLAGAIGMPKMVKLHSMMWEDPDSMEDKVEKLTSKPAAQWRQEWLKSIGAS